MEASKDEFNIPDIIADPRTQKQYAKGKFLGKGGFARCYELIDKSTNQVFAGKVVPKSMLIKPHQKEKVVDRSKGRVRDRILQMQQEVTIHQSLNHRHIVQFFSYFEDENNVYIVLELCRRRVKIFTKRHFFTREMLGVRLSSL